MVIYGQFRMPPPPLPPQNDNNEGRPYEMSP